MDFGVAHTDDSRVLKGFSARAQTSVFIPHFRFWHVQMHTFKHKDVGQREISVPSVLTDSSLIGR